MRAVLMVHIIVVWDLMVRTIIMAFITAMRC
jgi:hypothetical protein